MSLSVVRDLKDPSESLSLGKAFQMCGAEKRIARLAKSVRTNGSDSCVLVVERRDRAPSRVVTWWLRYVGIEVVRTLNVTNTSEQPPCM